MSSHMSVTEQLLALISSQEHQEAPPTPSLPDANEAVLPEAAQMPPSDVNSVLMNTLACYFMMMANSTHVVPTPQIPEITGKIPQKKSRSRKSSEEEETQTYIPGQSKKLPKHMEQVLIDRFNADPFINRQERNELAAQLSLPPAWVKIWFQNRRYREDRKKKQQQQQQQQQKLKDAGEIEQ